MPRKKETDSKTPNCGVIKTSLRYQPEFCEKLLAFFDIPPFRITEITKKDGSVSLIETAAELPTFAAFAKQIGTTCEVLKMWEKKHAAFREAALKARDLQSNILIQNSLRGNYSASFAMFTAKNLLGWKDGKDEPSVSGPISIRWEEI